MAFPVEQLTLSSDLRGAVSKYQADCVGQKNRILIFCVFLGGMTLMMNTDDSRSPVSLLKALPQ